MPLGMLSNALLQASFRLIARARIALFARLSTARRLVVCVASGLCVYFASAALLVRCFILRGHDTEWLWAVSIIAFALHVIVGVVMLRANVPAPKGRRQSSRTAIAGRGLITAAIFLLAMYVGDAFPAIGGVLVNFPFVTIAMVATLWMGQGEDVAVGALNPMALGMLSASLYALLAAALMPWLNSAAEGGAVAWFVSVAGVSAPLAWILHKIQRARDEPDGVQPGAAPRAGDGVGAQMQASASAGAEACAVPRIAQESQSQI